MIPLTIWFFLVFWGDRPVQVGEFYNQQACEAARVHAIDAVNASRFGGPKFAERMVTPCWRVR